MNKYSFYSKMNRVIEIDLTIFSYLNTYEILKILKEYFNNTVEIKRKLTIKLKFGNKSRISEIVNTFPVIIQCDNIIDKDIYWTWLSENPNAIHLLEKNIDKINSDWLSLNPKAIHLLEIKLDKINNKLIEYVYNKS